MIKSETQRVTQEHGPRPAGRPDQCFYCGQPVGEDHQPDCVMRERTVVIEWTIRMVVKVPESFTQENIEFKYNGSSYCNDNLLSYLDKEDCCLCQRSKVIFVREATEQDEKDY